ncbi:MAG: VapE family protein [Tabrizicola sp.]|nr:VapE family protein [Tabrizicola sp.]MDZ4069815.1 VapE family protein [Tabrizicola sp.]
MTTDIAQDSPIGQHLADLLEIGAALHWLHARQKRPIADGWSEAARATRADLEREYSPGANVGVRLGEPSLTPAGYLHLLDLDIRKPEAAAEAWAKIRRLVPTLDKLPSAISGSGSGRHFYFFSSTPLRSERLAKSKDRLSNGRLAWEIELFGTGKQAVLPPSIHPDTGQPYRWERPINFDLVGLGIGPTLHFHQDPLPEVECDTSEPDWPRIRSALEAIPGDGADYDTWREIGMALHSAAGGSDDGFATWCDWSKQDKRFKAREHRDKWKSFRRSGIGIGTLFHIAKENGWTPPEPVYEFDDLPALPEPAKPKIGIMLARNGDPKPTLHNAILMLKKVNRDQGYSIRKNEMTGQPEWRAGPINDADLDLIRVAIEQAGMHNVGAELTAGAVRTVAELNRYHPVRDWLAQLPPHDGRPRLDTWLSAYMGAEATPYSRAVGRAFLVAMVARVMQPGCKHDHVLVLGGSQGIGKSTACQILGGAWAGDNMPSIRDGAKEAGLYLKGHWLVELAELAPSRKAEAEDLKAFLSRSTDEIRAPYARRADVLPRQCVFIGTTNETAFLKDASGGRRFWPVTCGAKIDTESLAADREQLFAQALAAFNAGETWHLTPEMERQATIEQESAREEHPWEAQIKGFLDGDDTLERLPRDRVTVSEVLTQLGIPLERQPGKSSRDAASILKLLGWTRKHTEIGKAWVPQ